MKLKIGEIKMLRDMSKFVREFPHIHRLFQTAKAHHIKSYGDLKDVVAQVYQCDVMELTKAQAEEMMHRIHNASPRKIEKRKWHK